MAEGRIISDYAIYAILFALGAGISHETRKKRLKELSMAVLMITFNLTAPEQDYSPIFDFIKNINVWAKLTDSCYAVSTHLQPQELLLELRPHLTRNDSLYILTQEGPWIGFGPDDVNEWLRERLG